MVVAGTRPETIKMAPLIKRLLDRRIRTTFVHTGQHFDYEMGLRFIHELNLPHPEYSFRLRSNRPASQTAEIMLRLEKVIDHRRPNLVLIQGDTNSMLASALTGVRMMIPVGHVEAGLRSYDWRMPEEHNRRMVDHVSDHLFAPTRISKMNLLREKVIGKIYVVGNTVIDSINQYLPKAEKESNILSSVPFSEYVLVTLHRQENVDDLRVLRNLVDALIRSSNPIVFPVHPRTQQRLKKASLWTKISEARNIRILPPVGYLDFLILMKHCRIIASDSGGVQEEATSPKIRKHVLILRDSTERPEAVTGGFATLVGTKYPAILKALRKFWGERPESSRLSPFGDGRAAMRIARIVADCLRGG